MSSAVGEGAHDGVGNAGTAPALITGAEKPISNVVRQNFTIAG